MSNKGRKSPVNIMGQSTRVNIGRRGSPTKYAGSYNGEEKMMMKNGYGEEKMMTKNGYEEEKMMKDEYGNSYAKHSGYGGYGLSRVILLIIVFIILALIIAAIVSCCNFDCFKKRAGRCTDERDWWKVILFGIAGAVILIFIIALIWIIFRAFYSSNSY